MCLEFLCSWCHGDEDGPEHHRPQTPAGSAPYYSNEHKKDPNQPFKQPQSRPPHSEPSVNTHPYPTKDDPPSKALSEQSVIGPETEKDEYNHAHPTRNFPPPNLHWEPPSNRENMSHGEYYTNPTRYEPVPNPRWEPYDQNENHIPNGLSVNGDSRSRQEHLKTNYMAYNGERTSTAVHPRPNVSVPHVGNNTVLTAPVHQPNLRRGAESNVLHRDGHNYPL